jgi:O-antigen ligase
MYLLLRSRRIKARYTTHFVVAITGVLVLYELVIQNVIPGTNLLLGPLAGLVGKDTSFSARSQIWQIIKDHIALNPWLGTGYGAYWTGALRSSPSYIFMTSMYFYPAESHNGYLEIVNDFGYVGLIGLAVFIVSFVRQALRLMPWDRSHAVLFLGLLFQAMVVNMQESEWLARSDCFTVLALASVSLSRSLLEVRLRLAQHRQNAQGPRIKGQ